MKSNVLMIRMLMLGSVCAFVAYLFWSKQVTQPLPFKSLTPPAFAGLITWLFAVALFVERAIEIVVMVFRDQKADLLNEAQVRSAEAFEITAKASLALASSTAATQAEKDAAATAAATSRQALVTAQANVIVYRAETKEIALLVGFAFGALVSVAGVRALNGFLVDNTPTATLFAVADIVVTSSLIAGGSEGIHRIANVFTSFMDSLSTQIDKKQNK